MISLRNGLSVEPVQWTATGRVQVKQLLVCGAVYPSIRGLFYPVTAMELRHSDGPKALAAVLARLPHSCPAGSISVEGAR